MTRFSRGLRITAFKNIGTERMFHRSRIFEGAPWPSAPSRSNQAPALKKKPGQEPGKRGLGNMPTGGLWFSAC
jgi:hypothetical protein